MSRNSKDTTEGVKITSDGDSTIGGDVAGRDIVKTVVNVFQNHQGLAVVAIVAIFGIVALAISSQSKTAPSAQSTTAPLAWTRTSSSASPPLESAEGAVSKPPTPAAEASCLTDYFNEIPSEKQIRLEVGTSGQDFTISSEERAGNSPIGPLGIWLTQSGQPIAGLKLLLLHEGDTFTVFSVPSVVDAECSAVINYSNVLRPASGSTLQNWDVLGIQLVDHSYEFRPGWQGDHIQLNIRELN
jgi:hypothetical protein